MGADASETRSMMPWVVGGGGRGGRGKVRGMHEDGRRRAVRGGTAFETSPSPSAFPALAHSTGCSSCPPCPPCSALPALAHPLDAPLSVLLPHRGAVSLAVGAEHQPAIGADLGGAVEAGAAAAQGVEGSLGSARRGEGRKRGKRDAKGEVRIGVCYFLCGCEDGSCLGLSNTHTHTHTRTWQWPKLHLTTAPCGRWHTQHCALQRSGLMAALVCTASHRSPGSTVASCCQRPQTCGDGRVCVCVVGRGLA